jgi:alkylmercury lyase
MSDQMCDCCGTATRSTDSITTDDRWLTEPVMNASLPSDMKRYTSQFLGSEIETLDALAVAIREVIGDDTGSDSDYDDVSVAIDDLCHVEDETPHRVTTADETYYFRCFYDGVALTHLADEPVEIQTESPAGELIEVRASPDGTLSVTPSDAVMSFGIATDAEPFATNDESDSVDAAGPTIGELAVMVMCPYVKAFPTRDAYAYWAEGSDGATVGMSLRDSAPFAAALTK